MQLAPARPPSLGRVGVSVSVVMLTVAAVAKVPTLSQPLLETHSFRQTQTAFTARIFHEQGIDLFRPEVPVLGPPWVVIFEFPLFQAMGSLLMYVLPIDTAMRTLGLATFLLTGWLLYRLIVRLAGAAAAVIALGAFLFSPFGLLWGRTSMIEYLATSTALGFLLAAMTWREGGSRWAYGSAMLAGTLAMLVKVTTGGFYLLPLLFYRSAWRDWRAWVLIGVPILAGFWWSAYADTVKAASEATEWLTSEALREWTFGVLAGRLDPAAWLPLALILIFTLSGGALVVWVLLAILRARELPESGFLFALLAAGVAPLLVIMPLYRHDYYFAAISPIVALMIGLGASWLWRRNRHHPLARASLMSLAAAWILTAALTHDYWTQTYGPAPDRERVMQAARYVAERSRPDEPIVILGRGWSPAVHYYAHRRGWTEAPRVDADDDAPVFICPYGQACQ